jgi:hypothetical protein
MVRGLCFHLFLQHNLESLTLLDLSRLIPRTEEIEGIKGNEVLNLKTHDIEVP